jgi:cation:H+ antiporter
MLGVRPIIIGLTIVAIGTSAPELAIGITAVSEGQPGLAIGNIAGTNIVNILLILGMSAVIAPLPLQLLSIKLDVPVMILASVLLLFMCWDGRLTAAEGWVLVALAVIYVIVLIRLSRKEPPHVHEDFNSQYAAPFFLNKWRPAVRAWNVFLLLAGIGLAILGADLLVDGASSIARALGVSDAVIGLTIVAIGTSAPEMVTTIVATLKNDRDVAVGNLIGSSITNIFVILGFTCVAGGRDIVVEKQILQIDLPLAALVAVACYPVFRSDQLVSRREGIIFVSAYVVYLVTLIWLRA